MHDQARTDAADLGGDDLGATAIHVVTEHRADLDLDPASWATDAACRGSDPSLFFPPHRRPASPEVKALCAACDVRAVCLEYAIQNRLAGIWGGTSETQRIQLRRSRRMLVGMGSATRSAAQSR